MEEAVVTMECNGELRVDFSDWEPGNLAALTLAIGASVATIYPGLESQRQRRLATCQSGCGTHGTCITRDAQKDAQGDTTAP